MTSRIQKALPIVNLENMDVMVQRILPLSLKYYQYSYDGKARIVCSNYWVYIRAFFIEEKVRDVSVLIDLTDGECNGDSEPIDLDCVLFLNYDLGVMFCDKIITELRKE